MIAVAMRPHLSLLPVLTLLIAGCGGRSNDSAEIEELLSRAEAMGLVTSVDELEPKIPQGDDATPLYRELRDTLDSDHDSYMRIREFAFSSDEATLDEALATIADMAEAYHVAEAAALKPRYSIWTDWREEESRVDPAALAVTRAAIMFVARSHASFLSGDVEAALKDMERLTKVLCHCAEPIEIHQVLVRGLAEAIWYQQYFRLVTALQSDEYALKRLIAMGQSAPDVDYRVAIGPEIAWKRVVIAQLQSGRKNVAYLLRPEEAIRERFQNPDAELKPLHPTNEEKRLARRAHRVEAPLLRYLVEVAEAWGDQKAVEDITDRYEMLFQDTQTEPANLIAQKLMFGFDKVHMRETGTLAQRRVAVIAAAAAYLHAREGAWPTLEEAAALANVERIGRAGTEPIIFRVEGSRLVIAAGKSELVGPGASPEIRLGED